MPSGMSSYLWFLKNDERRQTHTHTHTSRTDDMWMYTRNEVLVMKTFLAGLADPEAEVISLAVRCLREGLNRSFSN